MQENEMYTNDLNMERKDIILFIINAGALLSFDQENIIMINHVKQNIEEQGNFEVVNARRMQATRRKWLGRQKQIETMKIESYMNKVRRHPHFP